MLETVESIQINYNRLLQQCEWTFTFFFTIEYLARVYMSRNKRRYMMSFFGLVDLFSTVPTYISFFLPGTQYFSVIRLLRIFRVFRILKLAQYMGEAEYFIDAFQASKQKITVFLTAVLIIVTILGSFMYIIEGPTHGFSSIPKSVYWAIVTLTTVGYGDMSPHTPLGQLIASIVVILGYGIIAIPTGLVTVELSQYNAQTKVSSCHQCKKKIRRQ